MSFNLGKGLGALQILPKGFGSFNPTDPKWSQTNLAGPTILEQS